MDTFEVWGRVGPNCDFCHIIDVGAYDHRDALDVYAAHRVGVEFEYRQFIVRRRTEHGLMRMFILDFKEA